jgi:hypothetical protein
MVEDNNNPPEGNKMQQKRQHTMSLDEAVTCMAARVVDRTEELIQDGWVKGALTAGFDNVEQFCVHGAMGLALSELFGSPVAVGRVNVCGGFAANDVGQGPVEALATAFIVDEVQNRHAFKAGFELGNMGAAPFNDDPATKHEDVLEVLRGAAKRLWDVALGTEAAVEKAKSWAPLETDEPAQQFMRASLA